MNKSTTPGSSSDKRPTSGKKLIQARLPFKVLSSSAEIASPPFETRKRKLSYSSDDIITTPKQIKQLKENLDSVDSDSIVISDNESLPEIQKDNQVNTSINSVGENQNQNVDNISMTQATSLKRNKLIIKLPLGLNKKRKKSKNLSRNQIDDNETSDPEIVIEEIHRLKKTKINENISSTQLISIPFSSDGDTEKKLCQDLLQNDNSKKENQINVNVQKLNTSNTEINLSSEEVTDNTNKGNKTASEVGIIDSIDTKEKVDDKKNEDERLKEDESDEIESTPILAGDNSDEATIQHRTPQKLSLEDNKSTIDETVERNQNDTSFKKKDNERNKKKETEDQKRKAKDEQRRKEKEEKEELKRIEKEEKEELKRKEKEEKEELKRKEKEEREELKRKEKEEKEKKRLAEVEAKNEEKRQKEDEKRKKDEQKEEERKKRDDEKRKKELEKEEAEDKKRKAAEAFTKFFRPKKSESKIVGEEEQNSGDSSNLKYRAFMPFQVKCDMKLAPSIRKDFSVVNKNSLNAIIADKCELPVNKLYLNLLKTRQYLPCKTDKLKGDTDDVIVIEEDTLGVGQSIKEVRKLDQKYRTKYFHFKENRRPPYYGTWRKKSAIIGPRKPFVEDKIHFDYDVDSDDEWEEEEPGESLHGSDDEKESEDEYEVDNEFFVPHGHLSDEEMQNEDETDQDNSPECQKAKLKLLQQEFAKEMKKKTEKIRPRLIGIVWVDANGNQPDTCPNIIWESLNKCAMILCTDSPLIIESANKFMEAGTSTLQDNKKQSRRNELPEELIADLIRLVHGNRHKKKFLIQEFQAFVAEKFKLEENPIQYSKAVIREKIDKISHWMIIDDKDSINKKKRLCWIVSAEILKLYALENISDKNEWNYILPPTTKLITTSAEKLPNMKSKLSDNKTDNQNIQPKQSESIKKFTKIISKDKILPSVITSQNKNTNSTTVDSLVTEQQVVKKTVPTLMSEPICQTFPKTFKNELIRNFLETEQEDGTKSSTQCDTVNSDIVVMDISLSGEQISKVKNFSPGITVQSNNINSEKVLQPLVKKRVPLLMSVPRGQAIPETFKNELIGNFIKKSKDKDATISKDKNSLSVITTQNNDVNSDDIVSDVLVYGEQQSNVEKFPGAITTESDNKVKKRVPLLLSVPRGQAIPETFKNELINCFLKKEKKEDTTSTTSLNETKKNQCPVDADSVIEID